MGDLINLYRDHYIEGVGPSVDEPLLDGQSTQIVPVDWAERPARSLTSLFFVGSDRYRHDDNQVSAANWLLDTRDTWSLLSKWKLCEGCRDAGIGATCPEDLARIETAFPPLIVLNKECDFCRLALHLDRSAIQQRFQSGRGLDEASIWEAITFMPNLRTPTSISCFLNFERQKEPGELLQGESKEDSAVWFGLCSSYITFEKDSIPSEPESGLTPTILDFIRQELADCLSSHSKCHRYASLHDDWPSRMLRITEEGTVILVDFEESMDVQYAALSYCWGSVDELIEQPALRATASTIPALRSGIQQRQLPRTIEQAVRICSHLGIQYLWVDALCIFQDDELDWEQESGKMATVYSRAKVTIIAASSTSCHSGFLNLDMGGVIFDTPPLGSASTMRLVGRLSNERGFHTDDFIKRSRQSYDPIDDRGWTFQEQVLSTRYIRFTQDDVQFECRSHRTCLCGQRANPSPEVTMGYRQWQDVPPHFNGRKFTITSDKLRALSGLAKAARRVEFGDIYLAGMWKRMLLDTKYYFGQLYWRCSAGMPEPCYDVYIAPSFCWASVSSTLTENNSVWGDLPSNTDEPGSNNVGATIKSYLGRALCKGLDAETTPLSASEPLGPVTDGFLALHAPLIPCLISSANGEHVAVASTGDPVFEFNPFYCRFDSLVSRIDLPDGRATVARAQHQLPFDATDADIILLRTVTENDETGSPIVGVEGMILGRCPDRNGFQRLGYIQIRPPGDISTIDWSKWETTVVVY